MVDKVFDIGNKGMDDAGLAGKRAIFVFLLYIALFIAAFVVRTRAFYFTDNSFQPSSKIGFPSDGEYNVPLGNVLSLGEYCTAAGGECIVDPSCGTDPDCYTDYGVQDCAVICCGWSSSSTMCDAGSWYCNNICTGKKDTQYCGGNDGGCTGTIDSDYSYCTAGYVCSGGSCLDGGQTCASTAYVCDTSTGGVCDGHKTQYYCDGGGGCVSGGDTDDDTDCAGDTCDTDSAAVCDTHANDVCEGHRDTWKCSSPSGSSCDADPVVDHTACSGLACGSDSRSCTGGCSENCACSGNDWRCNTATDKSCTEYCNAAGTCVDCTPSSCSKTSCGCCQGNACDAGNYCEVSTHACTALPECKVRVEDGFGYTDAAADTDPNDECTASWTSCDNQSARRGPDGACDGAGACDTNDATASVSVGNVCGPSGSDDDPSSSTDCGTGAQNCYCAVWRDCNDGSCSAAEYYTGYASGVCTATGWVAKGSTWNVASDYIISATTDAATCTVSNTGESPTYTTCDNQYTRRGGDGYCDGNGNLDDNDASTTVSVGNVCGPSGSDDDPSSSTDCGTGAQACYCGDNWYQCDAANDCTYDRYYVGFNNGASCIETGKVLRDSDISNPSGYRCNAADTTAYSDYNSVMDTNQCNGDDHCTGNTRYSGYTCVSGTCGTDNGDIGCCLDSKCSASQYCSGSYACTGIATASITSVVSETNQPLNSELGNITISYSGSLPSNYEYSVEETSPSSAERYYGTSTTYTHSSLEDNMVYCYRTRVQDVQSSPSHYGSWSSTVCNTTKDRTGPGTPNLTATADNPNNKISLGWSTNLIVNPSFDERSGNDFYNWTETESAGDGDVSITATTSDTYKGPTAVNITSTSGTTQYARLQSDEYIEIDKTKHYYLSGYFKSISGSTGIELNIMFYDGNKVYLGRKFMGPSVTTSWSRAGNTIHPYTETSENNRWNESTAYARIQIYYYHDIGIVLMDALQLEMGQAASGWVNQTANDIFNYGLHRSNTSTGNYMPVDGVWDDFSSDTINGYTVVGDSETWAISGGLLTDDSQNLYTYLIHNDAIVDDVIVEADVMTTDNDWVGIASRYTDISHFYHFSIRPETDTAELRKTTSRTLIKSVSFDSSSNIWYHLKVKVVGSSIKCYVDDVLVIDVTDTLSSSGKAGLYSGANSPVAKYDNFKVTPLISSNTKSDTSATDNTAPGTPSAPSVSAQSTTSLQVSWSGVSDVGDDYFYYIKAFDEPGNENNLFVSGYNFESGSLGSWDTNGFWGYTQANSSVYVETTAAYQGNYGFRFHRDGPVTYPGNNTMWGGLRFGRYNDTTSAKDRLGLQVGHTYILSYWYKGNVTSTSNANIYICYTMGWCNMGSGYPTLSIGSVSANTNNVWTYMQKVFTVPSNMLNGCDGNHCLQEFALAQLGYATTTGGEDFYIDDVKLYEIKNDTVTTGVDSYQVDETTANPGATDSGWQASPYTDSGLNCFSQYTYKVRARDGALNEGSYSGTDSEYPINYITPCSEAGDAASGYCADSGTCYYTGTGCPSSSCSDGTSSCYDDGYESGNSCFIDENCVSGGYTAPTEDTTIDAQACGSCGSGSCSVDYCWQGTSCYWGISCGGSGWTDDASSPSSTLCSAATSQCCPTQATRAESVGCTSSGAQGTSYDRDTSSARCTDGTSSGCTAYDWNGTQCCGDDSGEDWESAVSTGWCCYNGAKLNNNTASSSILCANGQLYDCNSQVTIDGNVDTESSSCGRVWGWYCDGAGTGANTWKSQIADNNDADDCDEVGTEYPYGSDEEGTTRDPESCIDNKLARDFGSGTGSQNVGDYRCSYSYRGPYIGQCYLSQSESTLTIKWDVADENPQTTSNSGHHRWYITNSTSAPHLFYYETGLRNWCNNTDSNEGTYGDYYQITVDWPQLTTAPTEEKTYYLEIGEEECGSGQLTADEELGYDSDNEGECDTSVTLCVPISYSATADSDCCPIGATTSEYPGKDDEDGKCVRCNTGTKVQTEGATGNNLCEQVCGADTSCDEVTPETCPSQGYICSSTCSYADRDTSQSYCEDSTGCTAYTFITGATAGTNKKCCGDDSGETWEAGADGVQSCCNEAVISDDTRCSNTDKWAVDGAYCDEEVYDSGSMSGTTVSGDDIVCGCAEGAQVCDSQGDADGTADGVCASNICDPNEVCYTGSAYKSDCDSCSAGNACDSNVNSGGTIPTYSADGVCAWNAGGTDNACCASGHIVDIDNDGVWDTDSRCIACSSSYDGYRCDNNRDGTWDGVCAKDNAASWTCDTNTVFYDGSDYRQQRATDGSTDGKACENGAIGSNGFNQEGYGLDDGTCDTVGLTAEDCDATGGVACDAANDPFYNTCAITSRKMADACDSTITSGVTWAQTGTCTVEASDTEADCDNAYEVVNVSGTYYTDCADASVSDADACDSSAASGGDFSADGICLKYIASASSASDCDTDEVCYNTTHYLNDCSACSSEQACDSDIDGSGYSQTGHCQGESCCAYGAGGSQGAACDLDSDCGIYSSTDTCYYNGDCPSACTCSYSTDTACPADYTDCEYGGCDENYCYDDEDDTCYYGSSTCGGSGWSDKSSATCYDPGYESVDTCYYDNGGSVDESNSCTSTGCTGISNEDHPSCTQGDMTGSSANCWTGTSCKWNSGDACAADTDGWDYTDSSTLCSVGVSQCCPTQATRAESIDCTSSGAQGTSYDRDTSQARCEDGSSSDCSAQAWMENVPTSGTQCCGDDGAENSYYYSANPTTATSLTCERCNAGSYVAPATYYGNGYKSGTTCYYGDITCTAASGANGASCTLEDANDACVADVGCIKRPLSLSATVNTTYPLNSELGGISLSWTDNNDAEQGFKIERAESTGSFSEIESVGASVTTYKDLDINDNTNYSYRVRAYYSTSYSTYSNVDSVFTVDRTGPQNVSLSVTADNTNNNIYANFSHDSSLVLYTPFEQGSGTTARDWSGENNDGTFGSDTAAPTWTTSGKYGSALSFDGGDYVDCGNDTSLDITNDITIGAWVNPNNVAQAVVKPIISKGTYDSETYYVDVYNGLFRWHIGNTGLKTLDATSYEDTWTHIVLVGSGGDAYFYINGIEKQTGSYTSVSSLIYPVLIGKRSVAAAYFDGLIDEVRIYNRSLTEREIINDYQSGLIRHGLYRSATSSGTYSPLKGPISFESAGYDSGNFARLYVNGTDYSDHERGHNLVRLDSDGTYVEHKYWDTYSGDDWSGGACTDCAWGEMANYLNSLSSGDIIIMGIMDHAGNINNTALEALQNVLGSEYSDEVQAGGRSSWGIISVVGQGKVVEAYEPQYQGPVTGNWSTIKTNSYTDIGLDVSAPNTPGAPSVSAQSTTSLQVSWSGVSDNGDDYFYYLKAFDGGGNENNFVDYPSFEDATDHSSGSFGTYSFVTGNAHTGDYSLNASGSFEYEIHPDYTLFKPGRIYRMCVWVREDAGCTLCNQYLHARWYFSAGDPDTTGGGDVTNDDEWHQTCVVKTLPSDRGDVTGFNWYVGYDTDADGFRYIDDLEIREIKSATVTTGLDTYEVDETVGGGGATVSNDTSSPYTDDGLNCFTQYTYRVRAKDNAGNDGAYSGTTNKYPIEYITPCSEAGDAASGYCADDGTCYYTGAGCPSQSCSSGTSSCFDDGYESGNSCYHDENCVSGGYTAPTEDTTIDAQSCSACTKGSCSVDYCWQGTSCYWGISCGGAGWVDDASSPTTTYCSAVAAGTTECIGGTGNDHCYYGVDCTSSGTQGTDDTDIGSDLCTCSGGNCNSGTCYNSGTGICYSGITCTASGWSQSTTNSKPSTPTNPTRTPQSASSSDTVTVYGVVSDTDSDNVKLRVCADTSCTTQLCLSGSVSSGTNASCSFTANAAGCGQGTCNVYLFALEASADACSQTKQSTNYESTSFTYDTVAPTFNSPVESPTDPATYAPQQNYQLNLTVSDTTLSVSKVVLEFNGTNYTDVSNEGSVYYRTFTDLAANTSGYSYKWYANDTVNNWDTSSTYTYAINKGDTSLGLWMNGTQADAYYNQGEIANISANVNASMLTTKIETNFTGVPLEISSGTPNAINYTNTGNLALGTYNITAYTLGNQNYSVSSQTHYLKLRALWKIYVQDITGTVVTNSEAYMLTQDGSKHDSQDVQKSMTFSTETTYFDYSFEENEVRDLYVDVPSILGKNASLRVSGISTTGGTATLKIFEEGEYAGTNPITGTLGVLMFIDPANFTYSSFNLTTPYSSNIDPNRYAHCLDFDFNADNCLSWEVINLTQVTSGKTYDIIWIQSTTLDGGGPAQAKPDAYPYSVSFNNTTSMEYNDFILVNVTVGNKGNASTANPVEIYCYIDNVLQSQNETQGALGPAPPVNTSDLFCNFTAPGAGVHKFNVSTMIKEQIEEWNYTNNNVSMWIIVYSGTNIRPVLVNTSTPTRGKGLNVTARLLWYNNSAIAEQNLTFTDETGSANMGDDFTGSDGYAEVNYAIPATSSLGPHTINVTYDDNATIYSKGVYNDSVSVDVYSTSSISFITSSGQTIQRGDTVILESLVSDSINASSLNNYQCKFYDDTILLQTVTSNSTGHCKYDWDTTGETAGLRTVQVNITDDAAKYYFADSPDDVDSISLTINALPVVDEPTYNVTPAEILRGNDIKISCDVSDEEDASNDLTVNISVRDADDVWSNETVGHVAGTFFRNYSTTQSNPLGNYLSVCSALDTDGGYVENSSTFLVWQNGTVSIDLNVTSVGYSDPVNASGQAIYSDTGYIASSDVEIKIGGDVKCTDTTDASGSYDCEFSAPNQVGTFDVVVEVTDSDTGKLITNSTSLTVSVAYGEEAVAEEPAADVGCYEVPTLVQNPDGSITKSTVRICVWE